MKNALIQYFYYWAGIGFLMLSKVKIWIKGYASPKPYGIQEFDRCIAYDIAVVDEWIAKLQAYEKSESPTLLQDKTVLELGPGSDLGVGLYLLSKSIKTYIAVDVNNLVEQVPEQFYHQFFDHLTNQHHLDTSSLAKELEKTQKGNNDRLDYICRKDFDIVQAAAGRKMDLVFSQAAFEHFDDVTQTIRAISEVTKPGGQFIALVDLQTHSRWIRDKDPNNIYRYSTWLYRLLSASGTPNRVRPYQYEQALVQCGWKDIVIKPSTLLEDQRYGQVKNHLDSRFRNEQSQMNYLGIWICATKA